MRQVLIRTVVKGITVLIGILLISSLLQFTIWVQGPELVELMMKELSFPPSYINIEKYEQIKGYLYRELGLDRPFVPDLWPFDNESLWHKEPASR